MLFVLEAGGCVGFAKGAAEVGEGEGGWVALIRVPAVLSEAVGAELMVGHAPSPGLQSIGPAQALPFLTVGMSTA